MYVYAVCTHTDSVYIYIVICIVLFILYVYVPQAQLNQSCIDCEPVCDEKRQRWCFGRIAWSWCWYGDAREERHELKRKERSIKTHQLAWNPFEFLLCFHSFRTTWPPVILVCSTAIQVEGMAQVHTPTCKAQSPQPEFTLAPSRYVSRVAADWAVPQGLKHSFALFLKFCNHTDYYRQKSVQYRSTLTFFTLTGIWVIQSHTDQQHVTLCVLWFT